MPTKTLGPWSGGLNLKANRGLSVFLNDNELGEAENVVISDEGFIEPRPGCKLLGDSNSEGIYKYVGAAGGKLSLVGHVDLGQSGIYAIVQVTVTSPTLTSYVYRINPLNSALLLTIVGGKATSLIVHAGFAGGLSGAYTYPDDNGVLIFTDSPTQPVFRLPHDLNPATPAVVIPSTYLVPPSTTSRVVKDRLFLFDYNKNIMWWSPATYILDFRTADAVTAVAPFGLDTSGQEIIEPTNDSGSIRCIEFYNNNFYIFKKTDTYMFTYQLSPLTDGYMRKISDTMGAHACCVSKEKIIIINGQGIFQMEGTDFIDFQSKMNFRFEFPMDLYYKDPATSGIFINAFSKYILFGIYNEFPPTGLEKYYYYCMNVNTGTWSKWSFKHVDNSYVNAPKPINGHVKCNSGPGMRPDRDIFVDASGQRLLFFYDRPDPTVTDFHLDNDIVQIGVPATYYIPNVIIKTTASIGNSMINYKKLYKFYSRFYLSEPPALVADGPVWTISVNYNSYQFDSLKNPIFNLYPAENQPYPDPMANVNTVNYFRAYQLKIPQQRVKEFVFELKRKATSFPATTTLVNPDADRSIKKGYYFMLTALWFDFQDKTRI